MIGRMAGLGLVLGGLLASAVFAKTAAAEDAPGALAARQEAIFLRYQRFRTSLLQLSDALRGSDPARADLLMKAVSRSNDQRIEDQLSSLVELLTRDQLGDAVTGQQDVRKHLLSLLDLLQSENRRDELEKERERLQQRLKELERVIDRQAEARSANGPSASGEQAEARQREAEEAARRLADALKNDDAEKEKKTAEARGEKPPGEKKPGEKNTGEKGDEKPSGQEPAEGAKPPAADGKKPSGAEKATGDPKPGAEKPPMPGQPQPGAESPPMGDSPSTPGELPMPGEPAGDKGTPGREELEQARERMEQALEQLQQQKKQPAGDLQDRALAELLAAKKKLEEILRQMREEEKELRLVALEARLKQMLVRQIAVYDATVIANETPEKEREDRFRAKATELSRLEEELATDTAKALSLVKEEGTSVSYPHALELLQADLSSAARRLEKLDTGELTLSIEKDAIDALKELVEAFQKDIEKAKEQKQPQQPGKAQPSEQEQSLVQQIAELKMLRSLQYRVNHRTTRVAKLVQGDRTRDPDLARQLRELSARQSALQRATYDLATGKNQ